MEMERVRASDPPAPPGDRSQRGGVPLQNTHTLLLGFFFFLPLPPGDAARRGTPDVSDKPSRGASSGFAGLFARFTRRAFRCAWSNPQTQGLKGLLRAGVSGECLDHTTSGQRSFMGIHMSPQTRP